MEKFFTEENLNMLLDIFHVYSPSRNEKPLADLIKHILDANKIKYTQDDKMNIFCIDNKGVPMLSSHMDCVGDDKCGSYVKFIDIYDYKNDKILKGFGNIGADDKCGTFLTLLYILSGKPINFVFSVGEEIGNIDGISHAVESMKKENKENFNSIPYTIVLDRKHFGDIICLENNYGTKEFDAALNEIGKKYGYKTVKGGCSDANTLNAYMNCANISVSYFNPHSKSEYVSLKGLFNSWEYLCDIIDNLKRDISHEDKVTETEVEIEAGNPAITKIEKDSIEQDISKTSVTNETAEDEITKKAQEIVISYGLRIPDDSWTIEEIEEYYTKQKISEDKINVFSISFYNWLRDKYFPINNWSDAYIVTYIKYIYPDILPEEAKNIFNKIKNLMKWSSKSK